MNDNKYKIGNYDIHRELLVANAEYKYENVQIEYDYAYNKNSLEYNAKLFPIGRLSSNELETVIHITNLVHKFVKNNSEKQLKDSDLPVSEAIKIIQHNDVGGNCKTYANVLQSALLFYGVYNKVIYCKPIDLYFNDCHVVNHVYIKKLNKWVLMDAAMNIYYTNSAGEFLNLEEIRKIIIRDKLIKINYIDEYEKFNENNSRINKIKEKALNIKLISYMAKNIFRFSILKDYAQCNVEIEYNLVPLQYINTPFEKKVYIHNKKIMHIDKYLSNPDEFWKIPT